MDKSVVDTLRPLPQLLAQKAVEELNEVPGRIQEDIQSLRQWAEKHENLKIRTSDQFLIAFLRGSKYSLERAKEKLEKYYSMRIGIQEIFKNRQSDDSKVLEILKQGVAVRLPLTNGEDGPRLNIIRPGAYDPSKFKFADIIKVGTIIADIQLLEDDNAVVSGLVEVMDLANVTVNHMFHIDVSFVKKFSAYSEEGMPIRQKGFHFLNTPPGFETLYNIFKPLVSEKNRNRVFVHGSNMESFYQQIPKTVLPAEYGGECGTIKDITDYWVEKFLSYAEYFKDEENFGSHSKLKNEPSPSASTNSRLEGSFRKLEVD